ncbi:MAG TPA: NAD(P)H-dependent oxidoreductase [Rhizomicrobium sp.]|nr:NAD(P)H-dependent oxidoreductase [Rhizomicrobium sp.]
MSSPVNLIAFAGSTRKDSYNRRVVEIAAEGARAAGAEVQVLNLKDFNIPFYDPDLEAVEGMPPGVQTLKNLFLESDGFLIAAPEYNGSMPGLLKNAIDWVSRPAAGETQTSLTAFRGKVAGIMSASPGPWGGVRGLAHLRQILSGMFVLVVAEQLAVPNAADAFEPHGALKNATYHTMLEAIGKRVAHLAKAMKEN